MKMDNRLKNGQKKMFMTNCSLMNMRVLEDNTYSITASSLNHMHELTHFVNSHVKVQIYV